MLPNLKKFGNFLFTIQKIVYDCKGHREILPEGRADGYYILKNWCEFGILEEI